MKEPRSDRVTKEGNQKNVWTEPCEAKKRSMRRTHGRETQRAEKTTREEPKQKVRNQQVKKSPMKSSTRLREEKGYQKDRRTMWNRSKEESKRE